MSPPQNSLALFRALPKIELHVHLEGAIRPSTVEELAHRFDASFRIADWEWTRPGFRYDDLSDFVATMRRMLNMALNEVDDYARSTHELLHDLADENVRYAEPSVSMNRLARMDLDMGDVLRAIDDARLRAEAERDVRAGIIIAFGREGDLQIAEECVKLFAEWRAHGVVGIDLHGDESAGPAAPYADVYRAARDAGLGLRAHAGEGMGADSVWEVVRSLDVSRIAHGVRAIEDERLVDYLSEHGITLDICPASNVKLRVAPSVAEHPIRALYDRGVPVTVSTDDPLMFMVTMSDEYAALAEHLGFTLEELKGITLNAVDAAFLPDDAKRGLRATVMVGHAVRHTR
ncbi:adenosine deaminase [Candidatus Poribacteria bacterium]|nr:adenosine deaminase [Candidatus Poribacteria bacterium]MBT5535975.1 adenosine deaminase [Candidatus Poribacteria bacterium]MBT5711011.1 adenosine deaminase [Candidatus Poribacteria bacterium]MBT7808737.1 adenosine deaminase [Candidatus Poribacteria bacterium]